MQLECVALTGTFACRYVLVPVDFNLKCRRYVVYSIGPAWIYA